MANMALPDSAPLPPPDFPSRELPIETVPAGTVFVRFHRSDLEPIFFGTTGNNRFDDPNKAYGVCYLARTPEGAFAEACLRAVGARFVSLTFLEARSFSEMEVSALLRLVSVHGPGLAQIGATSVVTSGAHSVAQQWSHAIRNHPANPDGITYRSNHDNGEFCVTLFDHVRNSLIAKTTHPITGDRVRLAELRARYKVGLG